MAGPTPEQVQSNIPSNPLPTPASPGLTSTDILEKLVGFGQQGDIMKLAAAAATPIPGGHFTQMPASLMYQPKQFQPGQLDTTPQVGAGNAHAQGIGNSVISVMNMISKIKTDKDNKARLQIATDTASLINMQQDIDKAKQYLDMLPENDPRRKQYQSVIDANMHKMNAILSDDKTRKAISEGFKIDFTNPKEQTEENKAVMQGKAMAEHQSNADKFMQQTPQALQPNLPAQAQYQAAAAQQKIQAEIAKSMMSYITTQMRTGTQLTMEQMRQFGANAREQARLKTMVDIAQANIMNRASMQSERFKHDFLEINAREKAAERLVDYKGDHPTKDDYDKTLLAMGQHIDSTLNTIRGYQDSMRTTMDDKGNVKDQKSYDELKTLKDYAELQLGLLQKQRAGFEFMFRGSKGEEPTDSSKQADFLDNLDKTDHSDSEDQTDVQVLQQILNMKDQ